MKILVVMGSPRKGNTYRAVRKIEEVMRSMGDVEFEYLMLKDVNLSHCCGCFSCFEKGEEYCPFKDDAYLIEQKMHDADGVIFATPVYGMGVSAQMKTFIDRLSYIFHRPRFFDKKALLLSTAGAGGLKDVLDHMQVVAGMWGFEVVQKVGIIAPPIPQSKRKKLAEEQKLRKAAVIFYDSLLKKRRRSPSFREVIVFRVQKTSYGELAETLPADHAYWKEHGWLRTQAKYYVDVPVNPLYNAVGWTVEQILRRKIRKDKADAQK
ncbi:MAG: flavodoxin family protein [Methanomethylovorans sp.]|jgi:multimeric flavodoxin WrbA|nr:flavodoxin family protein [Methanomethylovorans sp.]